MARTTEIENLRRHGAQEAVASILPWHGAPSLAAATFGGCFGPSRAAPLLSRRASPPAVFVSSPWTVGGGLI
jgi:hypothetical protein